MDKIIALMRKNILITIAGIVAVAGGVYVGTSGGVSTNDTSKATQVDTKATTETKADPTYVNTQWNDAVGGTKGMPENWPKDAPVAYAGATLMSSLTKNLGTGKLDPSVIYFSDVSGPEMIAYYVKGLESNGWKIEANALQPGSGYHIITAKKDTRTFAVFVSVGPDGKTGVTSGVTF